MDDFDLMEHQINAIEFLGNGKILYGEVGTGKSATALAYYMNEERPRDIYVITTAKKRDSLDWMGEAAKFGIGTDFSVPFMGTITIDSWNNIGKYTDVRGAFFVFDEQRLIGTGAWVKSFLKIANVNNQNPNHWIMLSATPGDTWLDYAPVFVANGWYRSIGQFKREHVVYAPYVKFPKVLRYVGVQKLERLRNQILVEMPYAKHTNPIVNFLEVGFDREMWETAVKRRWNPYTDSPIQDAAELFRVMRRINNTDPSRLEAVEMLMKVHPKLVIFYNFNYELEILRLLDGSFYNDGSFQVAEWNGHRKDPVPRSDNWLYLVQYNAGAEGWNCIETNAMILYSLTYSYKNYIQAQGRIDRITTSYINLYYYVLISSSLIDRAVREALSEKRSFNEREWLKKGQNSANIFGPP